MDVSFTKYSTNWVAGSGEDVKNPIMYMKAMEDKLEKQQWIQYKVGVLSDRSMLPLEAMLP